MNNTLVVEKRPVGNGEGCLLVGQLRLNAIDNKDEIRAVKLLGIDIDTESLIEIRILDVIHDSRRVLSEKGGRARAGTFLFIDCVLLQVLSFGARTYATQWLLITIDEHLDSDTNILGFLVVCFEIADLTVPERKVEIIANVARINVLGEAHHLRGTKLA
jgi:hypothetical protein